MYRNIISAAKAGSSLCAITGKKNSINIQYWSENVANYRRSIKAKSVFEFA